MKTPDDDGTWGGWVRARAEFVGIRSQKELAKAVGVSPKVISQWLKRPDPPRLRSESVSGLAHALNTNEAVIRHHWIHYAPDRAPGRDEFNPHHLLQWTGRRLVETTVNRGYRVLAGYLAEQRIAREITSLTRILGLRELQVIHALCWQLARFQASKTDILHDPDLASAAQEHREGDRGDQILDELQRLIDELDKQEQGGQDSG